MTEEEFFMGFAEMVRPVEQWFASATEFFVIIGVVAIGASIIAVGYIGLGEAWKGVRRIVSQRANPIISVTLRHKKGKRQ